MIDTIPQKIIDLVSTKTKDTSSQVINRSRRLESDKDSVHGDKNDLHSFEWLNLLQPTKHSFDEEIYDHVTIRNNDGSVDTNNNSKDNINFHPSKAKNYLSTFQCSANEDNAQYNRITDIHDYPDGLAHTSLKPIALKQAVSKNYESHKVKEANICTSSRPTKETHLFYSGQHSIFPRPILKYGDQKNRVSDLVKEEYSITVSKNETPNSSSNKVHAVSFFLPSDVSVSTQNDIVDGEIMSYNNSFTDANDLPKFDSSSDKISNIDRVSVHASHDEIWSKRKKSFQISPPSSFSDSDTCDNEATTLRGRNLSTPEISYMTNDRQINIQEGGRYSILNRDFTPKTKEGSTLKEFREIRKEILSQRARCELDVNKWKSSSTSSLLIRSKGRKSYNFEDSSGESTDTLLEEAKQYIDVAKEKIVTMEDWNKIDLKKKKYKKR